MAAKIGIVLRPPECCCREQEELRPGGAQRFKMLDRRRAVGRIFVSVSAVRGAREMPGSSLFAQIEQRVISLACDEHDRAGRESLRCDLAYARNQHLIVGPLTLLRRLPCDFPLLLKSPPIRFEELGISAVRYQVAK